MDAVFLAVAEILPRAVDGIRQYAFGIVSIGLAVGLHRILKRVAFIERVPTEYLNSQKSVDVTHPDLCAEFNRGVLLPSDDGTHPGLTETDDAIIDPGAARFVHLALLSVQRADDRQSFTLPPGQGVLPFAGMVLNHRINVLQISAEVVELLSPGLSDASPGLPAALGESVVLLLCHDAVGSGLPAVREPCCV